MFVVYLLVCCLFVWGLFVVVLFFCFFGGLLFVCYCCFCLFLFVIVSFVLFVWDVYFPLSFVKDENTSQTVDELGF